MNTIVGVGKQNKTFETPWHENDVWELFFCTNGSGWIQTKHESVAYTYGDLVVVAPKVPYINQSKTGFSNLQVRIDGIQLSLDGAVKLHESASKFLSAVLSQIYYVYNNEVPNKALLMQNYGDLISNLLISFIDTKAFSPAVENIRMACVRHFSEPDFDLNALFEQEHAYNTNYLKKLFTKEVGASPQQFLIGLRMNFAQKVLANIGEAKYSISQIALTCGYEDPLYFSRVFKATTGYSPKAYIQVQQKK